MLYIKLPSKYPYRLTDLILDNPDVIFPNFLNMTEEARNEKLAEYNVVPVVEVAPPSYNVLSEKLVDSFEKLSNGTYKQKWLTVPLTNDEKVIAKNQFINVVKLQVQNKLDDFAKERGYDNVNSAAKYKDITDAEISSLPQEQRALVTKFRAESRYLAVATASTWAKLYLILNEVEAGTRPAPSSYQEIEAELPELVWPV